MFLFMIIVCQILRIMNNLFINSSLQYICFLDTVTGEQVLMRWYLWYNIWDISAISYEMFLLINTRYLWYNMTDIFVQTEEYLNYSIWDIYTIINKIFLL